MVSEDDIAAFKALYQSKQDRRKGAKKAITAYAKKGFAIDDIVRCSAAAGETNVGRIAMYLLNWRDRMSIRDLVSSVIKILEESGCTPR